MAISVTGFDWDPGNRNKCRKHGVSIAEIEALFSKPVAVFPDPAHSQREERFKAIGSTKKGRHIFLVFALRKHGAETFDSPDQRSIHAQKGSEAL